jgi:hypothetical protein
MNAKRTGEIVAIVLVFFALVLIGAGVIKLLLWMFS